MGESGQALIQLTEGSRFGPFELMRRLGEGGMAEIHLAKTHRLGGFEKYCALKVIHAELASDDLFVQMLIDEAKTAVMLSHANIAQTLDLGVDRGRYYIAMEFIDGIDLDRMVRALGALPQEAAAFVLRDVCCGLDYAHNRRGPDGKPLGLVHRDISSQNVVLSRSGEVKIVDFGVAKSRNRSVQTQTGVIKGKYAYMSPEQARAEPLDSRSDIYSAGAVLYEAVTGRQLYDDHEMAQLLDRVQRGEMLGPDKLPPHLCPELRQALLRALAPLPEDRWQTASEFETALARFLARGSKIFGRGDLVTLVLSALERVADDSGLRLMEGTTKEQILTRREIPSNKHSVLIRHEQSPQPSADPALREETTATAVVLDKSTDPQVNERSLSGRATQPVLDQDILGEVTDQKLADSMAGEADTEAAGHNAALVDLPTDSMIDQALAAQDRSLASTAQVPALSYEPAPTNVKKRQPRRALLVSVCLLVGAGVLGLLLATLLRWGS